MVLGKIGRIFALRDLADLVEIGVEILWSVVEVGGRKSPRQRADDEARECPGADAAGDQGDCTLAGRRIWRERSEAHAWIEFVQNLHQWKPEASRRWCK